MISIKRPLPNYDSFHSPDIAYSNFIRRLESVINIVAPIKTVRIKHNTSEWFNVKIVEKIHTQKKLCRRFKLTTLYVDENIYKDPQNAVQSLIRKMRKTYFEKTPKTNTANRKKIRKP